MIIRASFLSYQRQQSTSPAGCNPQERRLSRDKQIILEPRLVSLLAEAQAGLGQLSLLKRAWGPWLEFAYWPLSARWAAREAANMGHAVDLAALLALGPLPQPNRPTRGLRLACGLVLAKRKLEAGQQDVPLLPSQVAEIFYNVDAPHLARGGQATPVDLNLPGSGVWSLAPRLLNSGLPPLIVAGITLASWYHQGPSHPNLTISGWVLLSGLASRLGLIPQALEGLGPVLRRMDEERGQELNAILQRLRHSGAWREWLAWFLEAVALNCAKLVNLALAAQNLLLDHRELVATWVRAPRHPAKLLDLLLKRPVLEVPDIAAELEITQRTAGQLVKKLKELAILREMTGQRRGRRFAYLPLLQLLLDPESP